MLVVQQFLDFSMVLAGVPSFVLEGKRHYHVALEDVGAPE